MTTTGFVVRDMQVLLHWHRKVRAWLPPGGHIDENEDPVQAVLREIQEESGIQAEVVPTGPRLDLAYPTQVPAPFTIMIEDIDDPDEGCHQHIDLIYFCRPTNATGPLNDGWIWVSKQALAESVPLERAGGRPEPPPDDVRLLAFRAFEVVGS